MPASTPLAAGAKIAKRVLTCLEFFLCETAGLSRSCGIAQVATRLASSGQSGHTEASLCDTAEAPDHAGPLALRAFEGGRE